MGQHAIDERVRVAAAVVAFVFANGVDVPPAHVSVALLCGLLLCSWVVRGWRVRAARS